MRQFLFPCKETVTRNENYSCDDAVNVLSLFTSKTRLESIRSGEVSFIQGRKLSAIFASANQKDLCSSSSSKFSSKNFVYLSTWKGLWRVNQMNFSQQAEMFLMILSVAKKTSLIISLSFNVNIRIHFARVISSFMLIQRQIFLYH